MYLYDTKTGDKMQGDGFIQPMFNEAHLSQADRLEVWATSMTDAGEYCEFRLMKGDEIVAKRTVGGY